MAIAFVQSAQNIATSATSVSVTLSVTAGNLIAVLVSAGTFTTVSGVTDGVNTYIDGLTMALGYSHLWYTTATTTGSVTITVASSLGNLGIIAQEFSGHTSWTLDKTANANGTSTSLASGNTASTTQADELVLGLGTWASSGGAATVGSTYSNLASITTGSGLYSAVESKVVSSAGVQSAALTIASSAVWSMGCAAFYGSGGGAVRKPKSSFAFMGNLGII